MNAVPEIFTVPGVSLFAGILLALLVWILFSAVRTLIRRVSASQTATLCYGMFTGALMVSGLFTPVALAMGFIFIVFRVSEKVKVIA